MTVVLDENLPKRLKGAFAGHSVTTVQEMGLSGTRNGDLLGAMEGMFDVFITADKNLRYQQNLSGRRLAIIELPTNRLPLLRSAFSTIAGAAERAGVGDYIRLTF